MSEALGQYGRILRARWRWIVWGILIALAAATTAMLISSPLYRSDALVFIRTPGDTSRVADGGALYASVRADTYAAMVTRGDLARRVVADLGLDISPGTLSKQIHAKAYPGAALISLTVDGSSPADAQRIANVVISEWQASVLAVESVPGGVVPRAELVVVDPPDRAVRIVVWGIPFDRALLAVIVLGAVLGATAAVFRELFGPLSSTEDDDEGGASTLDPEAVADDRAAHRADLTVSTELAASRPDRNT
jgi:capsular polysaccharide biosynthesis protein